MNLNPEQKKILRDALIAALVVANPLSLPIATLSAMAKNAGFPLDVTALEAHLDYLEQKGFAQVIKQRVSAAARRWKATAEAVDYAESEGLV